MLYIPTKKNCQVDYGEFVEGMSSFKNSGEKALRFCFDIYDKDGVGSINLDQLRSVLSCVTTMEDLLFGGGGGGSGDEEDKDNSQDQGGKRNKTFFSASS